MKSPGRELLARQGLSSNCTRCNGDVNGVWIARKHIYSDLADVYGLVCWGHGGAECRRHPCAPSVLEES
ncbi:hypothetical protein ANANG_G00083690 [Anguilla anguilla]|uniref:Uncharacterized protein n=1 Tax=Anguilla anguilla TaxID=7936 RepID=A0A9D3MKI6_ANGAN|nr:hypothetical protein ANANG_G00083690 [Anguilla anguilla]